MVLESPGKSSWPEARQLFGRYLLPVLKVLFTAFLILHAISLMQSLLHWAQEAKGFGRRATPTIEKVETDSLRPDVVRVTGRWIPGSIVAFKLNDRMEGTRWVGSDGRFTSPELSLPRQSNEVTVISVNPQSGLPLVESETRRAIPFSAHSQQGPKVDLWLEMPDTRALLLGAADPYSNIILEGPGIEPIQGRSDRFGIFALAAPANVVNSPGDFHLGLATLVPKGSIWSAPVPLLEDSNKAMLSRSITIKVGQLQSDFELVVNAPAKLPYIARLLQGDMDNDSFVNHVFGKTDFLPYRSDGSALERTTLIGPDGYARITLKGSTKEWSARLSLFSSGSGLGQWPLLSPKDSFTVSLDKVITTWTKPLPTTTDGKTMTWTGPLDQIALGVDVPASEAAGQAEDRERSKPGAVADLMSVVGFSLLAIIPFVWVIWLVHTDERFLADRPPQFVRGRQRLVTPFAR